MAFKQYIKNIVNKLPYIKTLHKQVEHYNNNAFVPAGHYYSPIVLVKEAEEKQDEIWKNQYKDGIAGIDLNTPEQLELLKKISALYPEMPFEPYQKEGIRYYFENNFYHYTDGIILYGMMRHIKPKKIIEVGSGFSSASILDVNQLFFDNSIHLTFIDPDTERLDSLLTQKDKQNCIIKKDIVQNIPLSVFEELEAGDILFIDSTHVSKTGSDVNYLLFEVLPALKSGVFIHIHDIFYPFEYHKKWVFEGRNWNENYILKAFLMYNEKYKIILFPDYLHRLYADSFKEMPLCYKHFGGSFWIEKQ
ncbi:class I SAM-dependent methyltransferase [Bernardetia sp. MNP-M8]|uniref:class I SAM-dependent methyltransferase n=1 Tax=Bernardetia sp. MNP-M8 TaxID=3127470 RepID=UPI0030CB5456